MPGSTGQLRALYNKLLGTADMGSFTASATGSLGEQLAYIIANLGGDLTKLTGTTDLGAMTASATGSLGEQLAFLQANKAKSEIMITPWSRCSLGVQLAAIASVAPVTAVWPAANKAIYVPFTLDEPVTVIKGFWYNGGVATGNVDIGIYDEAGARQVSMGSTVKAGANVIQEANIADTLLSAGRYYMGLSKDDTSSMFSIAPDVQVLKTLGVAEQAAAFALPATATLATVTAGYLPFFGFSLRTLVV